MSTIIVDDKIYGTVAITDPVLCDLIRSAPLERLKKINQFGLPDEFYFLKNFSRYDHCVGVMLLLRMLGASLEEQVAGLLHDVSHTAFSHLVDWLVGSGPEESFQDNQHERFIVSSEIPTILARHGLDVARIVDYHHFTLLEQAIPALCADRIDYSLREVTPTSLARQLFSDLTVRDNQIVFKSKESALVFARHFLERQKNHWGSFEAVSRYQLFAKALRRAMDLHLISFEDFWRDDEYVMSKVNVSADAEIQNLLSLLRHKSLAAWPKQSKPTHKKFRYVDPLYIEGLGVVNLSATDDDFHKALALARKENELGMYTALA